MKIALNVGSAEWVIRVVAGWRILPCSQEAWRWPLILLAPWQF